MLRKWGVVRSRQPAGTVSTDAFVDSVAFMEARSQCLGHLDNLHRRSHHIPAMINES
jgi:hypothetical protein